MTIDQVIALSASIGACLSAIAAFFAVKQNTKQHQASYHPELSIARKSFDAKKYEHSSVSFPTNWIEWKNGKESLDEDSSRQSFSLPLHNIGLGAAKEVKLTWSFPIESFVQTVNSCAQKSLIPAYFTLEDGMLSLKSDTLQGSISMWRNQINDSLDYVLPASVENFGCSIHIPPAYIELVSALICFCVKDKKYDLLNETPNLELKIEYLDIGGKKHTTSFEIEPHIFNISLDNGEFHGHMLSKKIT